jgi:endonuclease YncB( thermonuclease family)
MAGYNSAELRTKDEIERAAGMRARDALAERILDKIVTIRCGKWDKYGRLLIHVYVDGEDVNEWMVAAGYGAHYTGRGEKKW